MILAIIFAIFLKLVLTSAKDSHFEAALANATGIYQDPLRAPHLKKTVIITASNFGYLNHVYNFKCFMDRLGLKFLLIALDKRTYHEVSRHKNIQTIQFNAKMDVSGESQHFRSQQFNLISRRKMEAVYSALELGYDVLFIDTDVIVVNDPVKIMIWDNVDYSFSVNMICPNNEWDFFNSAEEGNTGFYFARSNPKVLKIWKQYFEYALQEDAGMNIDDQTLFWKAIRKDGGFPVLPLANCSHVSQPSEKLITCHPNTCQTGVGAVREDQEFDNMITYLKQNKMEMVSVHANYIIGNNEKQLRLASHGLWLATEHIQEKQWNGICKSYTPHII